MQQDEELEYQMSNDYTDYIFEGISEYEVFQTGLHKVQMLEQFMQICRDRMLSGFYEGKWSLLPRKTNQKLRDDNWHHAN